MAVEVTSAIVCDACGNCDRDHYAQRLGDKPTGESGGTGADVRAKLAPLGWVTRRQDGKTVDLCPCCK
jgi:hypothetical protein